MDRYSSATRQASGPPPKVVPCWPGGDCRGNFFPGQKCSQRQAGGDWLGDGDDVRDHAERLEGKDGSGAAEAALDFVENQGCADDGRPERGIPGESRLEHSWMPPSPKIGSSTMAQVWSLTAARNAPRSLRGYKLDVFEQGSKPLRYLSCPVSDMAPKVRP